MTPPDGRRPRTARPTLADVAREAGVSTALVSIVMSGVPGASDATRTRVRAIADDMGYVRDERARKLRQSSSRLVGVTFDLQQAFHGDLVEHLYGAAAARGYDLAISAVAPSRGDSTISTPAIPSATIPSRKARTCSPRNIAAKITVSSGIA